jgi:hypothetical protein
MNSDDHGQEKASYAYVNQLPRCDRVFFVNDNCKGEVEFGYAMASTLVAVESAWAEVQRLLAKKSPFASALGSTASTIQINVHSASKFEDAGHQSPSA